MNITLFGVCRLEHNSQPLALPRRQSRALLYRLAARLEAVPRAHLAFLFWPDEPEAAARRHLTRLLSGLRAALPRPDLLILTEESVALNPALCQCDSALFLRLVQQPASLAEAVALYAAPFMADFALPNAPEYEAWQQETARQLQQHYLRTVATLVAQETAVASYPSAIRYAQQYLATDELDETMHRRLIALYTAVGNRAAALRQYEQCALVLERELGVNPLPETHAALQAALQPPSPSTAPDLNVLPSLALPLIGRDDALAQMRAAAARFFARGGVILVTGESGMGKSRLLREYIVREQVGMVLSGSALANGRSLPYHPLIQALRPTLANAAQWASVPALWRSELLPLLPELRTLFADLPAPIHAAPALAQQRLYAALTQACRALVAGGRLTLCLDDLHWADEGTLGWLRFLAANWGETPLLVLATAVSLPPELAALRQTLARSGRLAEVALSGLSPTAVAQLLQQLPIPTDPELAARIHAVTGGNPFFVLEILRELQEKGQPGQPLAELPLPASVREAILARVALLSQVAQQLLQAAAVLTPHLDATLLQHTAARTEQEAADGLDELLAHGLLAMGNGQWAIAFPHGLLQTAVYQSLNPWRRRLLHRRAGQALAQFQPQSAAALAHHFAAAEEWETAVAHYQQAAAQARDLYAYEVALAQLDCAFALLPYLRQTQTARLALLRQRLALRRVLVQLPEWQADAADLLNLAAAASDAEAQLEALEAQISLFVLQSDFARAEETAVGALALAVQTGNRLAEARIRQTLGWHLADALGRSREGLAQLQMACRLARKAGETAVLYQSLCNLAFAQRAEGQCAAARASAEEALALTAYQPGSPPHPAFADALRELGEANAYLGNWQEARQQLRPLLDLYQTLHDPWAYGALLYNYGLYSSNMGLHEEAIAALRQLVALSESVGLPADSDYGIWHRAGLARVLLAAGQVAEAGALLGSLQTGKLGLGRPYLAWAKATAELHLAQGDGKAALAVLRPAVAWWRQEASLHDADVLLLLAQALLAVGEREEAETAVDEATHYLQPTDIARYHVRLHTVRYRVTGEATALAAARAELDRQAARFRDPALRAAFVKNPQGPGEALWV